jgi:ectoine hydroxylase-related dioxygenase (phytanoyl-CoA dioxygenase family)
MDLTEQEFVVALAALGVAEDTLSIDEKHQLDKEGFLIFPNLLDTRTVAELRDAFERVIDTKSLHPTAIPGALEEGARKVQYCEHKDAAFDSCYIQPKVLAAAWHIFQQPFHLATVCGRDPHQGHGQQPLHADAAPTEDRQALAVQTFFMLDDFTAENGAPRVVPRALYCADQLWEGGKADHPDQVLLTGSAGTVAVVNSHLWHSGTLNTNGQHRRTLHVSYATRTLLQDDEVHCHQTYISQETYNRISPGARVILNVEGMK